MYHVCVSYVGACTMCVHPVGGHVPYMCILCVEACTICVLPALGAVCTLCVYPVGACVMYVHPVWGLFSSASWEPLRLPPWILCYGLEVWI